ncbi:hypothetical protein HETIRDRAFT_174987 [Heterobasidion irregulare TC 32-1]|uniref:Uncharacterized protein n=1 Tax=Heterobasidion irregulare (strain TC 32-1) TaxID=747525 RepID=W4JTS6_HETIT|nr:uncharacterized protein HETIRDRAFT_174987 [Heterobasidion irregulare TC 32-1]ETW76948.1 hypothetical protein HETIRDRAFT_174987 [Heterobasidion irregulare TC 32-1]
MDASSPSLQSTKRQCIFHPEDSIEPCLIRAWLNPRTESNGPFVLDHGHCSLVWLCSGRYGNTGSEAVFAPRYHGGQCRTVYVSFISMTDVSSHSRILQLRYHGVQMISPPRIFSSHPD